jgi:hypothetical protein
LARTVAEIFVAANFRQQRFEHVARRGFAAATPHTQHVASRKTLRVDIAFAPHEKRVVSSAIDGVLACDDAHERVGAARERANDSAPHELAGPVIDARHGIADTNVFDRPSVDERAAWKALVDDDEPERIASVCSEPAALQCLHTGDDGVGLLERAHAARSLLDAGAQTELAQGRRSLLEQLGAMGEHECPAAVRSEVASDGGECDSLAESGRED